MHILYNFLIGLFYLGVIVAAIFNVKARKFLQGRNGVLTYLKKGIGKDDKIIWVHAASLGEFEQGRPVIEELKRRKPGYKILLTFFSPSGYEIRKKYQGADYICYLPLDFSWNARRFVNIVNPDAVYFIKYEFWFNYIHYIHQRKTPLFNVSVNFRPDQIFFKWYGFWYRSILHKFDHLFVQHEKSKELLANIGVFNVTVSGDTRFDRVFAIASQAKQLPLVEKFSQGSKVVVAGSTWPVDEDLLVQYINQDNGKFKYIIAPHEVHESNIVNLLKKLPSDAICYSKAGQVNLDRYRVLVIDNIGILSSVYQYGQVAYIGGAFGRGLHNILEAATFGLPVVFGPKFDKFKEALDLVEIGGVYSIKDYGSFKLAFDNLLNDDTLLQKTSVICKNYVAENRGATEIILKDLSFLG